MSDLNDYRDSNPFSLLASSKNERSNDTTSSAFEEVALKIEDLKYSNNSPSKNLANISRASSPFEFTETVTQKKSLSDIESYRDTNQYSILYTSNIQNDLDTMKCSSFIDGVGNNSSMENLSMSEINNQTDRTSNSSGLRVDDSTNRTSLVESSLNSSLRKDEICRLILLSIIGNIGSDSVNNSSNDLDEVFSIFHETITKSLTINQLFEDKENSKTSLFSNIKY